MNSISSSDLVPDHLPLPNAGQFNTEAEQTVYSESRARGFTAGMLLATIATHNATQAANEKNLAEQQYLARHDALTGLPNRLAFGEAFAGLRNDQHRRGGGDQDGRPNVIAILDIDHFKIINDTYGHVAGDEILKGLGAALKHGFRDRDVVARFGGEEFTVLLPRSNVDDAAEKIDEIRAKIAGKSFKLKDGTEVPISISGGVAALDTSLPDYTPSLQAADDALYHAKKSGRNKIVTSNELALEV